MMTKNSVAIFFLFMGATALFLLGTVGGNPGKSPKNNASQQQQKTDFFAAQKVYFAKATVTSFGSEKTGNTQLYGAVELDTLVTLSGFYQRTLTGAINAPGQTIVYESTPYKNRDSKDCDGVGGAYTQQCQQVYANCPRLGQAGTGLYALCFIFAFVLMVIQGASFAGGMDSDIFFTVKLVICAVTEIFFIAATASYKVDCFDIAYTFVELLYTTIAISRGSSPANLMITYEYGPGMVCPIVAGILTGVAMVLLVLGDYNKFFGTSGLSSGNAGLAPPAPATRGAPSSMQV
jgi:hypothetical protein